MKFDHMVKFNDVYYPAGEDVPMDVNGNSLEEISPPFSDKDIVFETMPERKKYTKTEINGMSKADLQALAAENGVSGAMEMTGTELKVILAEMLVN